MIDYQSGIPFLTEKERIVGQFTRAGVPAEQAEIVADCFATADIFGVTSHGAALLPAEYVIAEHYRLGSSMAILSRSFCNAANVPDLEELKVLFNEGVAKIRQEENKVKNFTQSEFSANQRKVQEIVCSIVGNQS